MGSVLDATAGAQRDEDLYRRLLEGDENCLRELLERYGSSLALYINGYIHDVNLAEDLMLESFSRLVVKKPRFDSTGFKASLYKTGRNLALRRSEKKRSGAFGFGNMANEPESAELFEAVVRTKERGCLLCLSMEELPPDCREVLYLLCFEGLSCAQASNVIRKTQKQIASLACNGRLTLRPLLEKEGINCAQYQ